MRRSKAKSNWNKIVNTFVRVDAPFLSYNFEKCNVNKNDYIMSVKNIPAMAKWTVVCNFFFIIHSVIALKLSV